MKRLAKWVAACILIVAFQLAFTLWYLVPYITDQRYIIFWEANSSGYGWHPLTPYHAWPILVAYGGALLALGITVAVAIGRSIFLREKEAIAQREAAVGLKEEEVRIARVEAERIRIAAGRQVQEAREEITRHEQEAKERIKEAEFRLERSVGTNMGRQRQIQKLRARVTELEERVKELVGQVTIGHC